MLTKISRTQCWAFSRASRAQQSLLKLLEMSFSIANVFSDACPKGLATPDVHHLFQDCKQGSFLESACESRRSNVTGMYSDKRLLVWSLCASKELSWQTSVTHCQAWASVSCAKTTVNLPRGSLRYYCACHRIAFDC